MILCDKMIAYTYTAYLKCFFQ